MSGTRMLPDGPLYSGYAYAYPHKRAYRRLSPPVPLRDAWADEPRDALFLYLHVPFCEARCGYCNLFTLAGAERGLVAAYVEALRRQAEAVRGALGEMAVARLAIGGGTPTLLATAELAGLLDLARGVFGADPREIPCSVEVSPRSVDAERLALLRDRGVSRISIGVQSFDEGETAGIGRAQSRRQVDEALALIRGLGFPVLNVDLIYGLPGQSLASWLDSIRAALAYRPEELYLYPLYVRPLTGLACSRHSWEDIRLQCYRAGRELLLSEGYVQLSMRAFRAGGHPAPEGPAYCCQEDGMVGLGASARSYTRALHYATEYATGTEGVREILEAFVAKDPEEFAVADHGVWLGEEDQRRRWVIKSLLRAEGFPWAGYRARFGGGALSHLPELGILLEHGLVENRGDRLCLTEAGLERSDVIGPFLHSTRIRRRIEECPTR